jgi:hypothetical protein
MEQRTVLYSIAVAADLLKSMSGELAAIFVSLLIDWLDRPIDRLSRSRSLIF